MHAYDELYVSVAQQHLGSMLDFAVNACGFGLTAFYREFLSCGLAEAFGRGNPCVLAGKSGIDLALAVADRGVTADVEKRRVPALDDGQRNFDGLARGFTPVGGSSPEFWAGWSLAYYQWESARTFADIDAAVPIERIVRLYHPLHEQDVSSFCQRMESLYHQELPQTALQRLRLAAGMSQAQLAQASGVPVRTLQQYEQGQKNIDKAQAVYVLQLARVLHCSPEALLEHSHMERFEYAAVSL